MRAPNYQASDFLAALQKLMPRGRAWPRDLSSTQAQVLAGLAPIYAALLARDNNLLVDSFPATAVELLPEWESTLGLPSPAAGPSPTTLARQTLVVARFVGAGGQGVPDYVNYAALLGYTVTVKGLGPFRAGQSRSGQQLGTVDQMFGWTITTPGATSTPFGSYGTAVLQYELQRIAPPYTVLNFIFT
jgi:uncharacterized protein YmfQ (DUF2313 family)